MSAPDNMHAKPVRPFYWSVRRELWEHRSVLIAPLAVACLILVGSVASTGYMPSQLRAMAGLDPAQQTAALLKPYDFAAFVMTVVMLVVALFYCLDALHGERRDRSLLFWKSLPVSDTTTVLAKAAIPLVVLPVIVCITILAVQAIMLQLGTVVLLMTHASIGLLWAGLPLLHLAFGVIYGMAVLTLWFAPVYGWLLLVSGWARSKPFLWAVLTPLGLCIGERIAFGTHLAWDLVKFRVTGVVTEGFAMSPNAVPGSDSPMQPDLWKFAGSSGLWTGLAVTAAFLAAATWIRRKREPL